MDERTSILNEIAVSGLFEVMTAQAPPAIQAQRVLSAMAHFADPSTRELTTSVYKIAWQAGTSVFPDQVPEVIQQLCDSGIVEKISKGEPPTYRVAGYQRLVEAKSKIAARIAAGEKPFPHVAPGPTGFEERRGSRPR